MSDIDELIAVLRDKIIEHGCELQISLLITNGPPCSSVIEIESVSAERGVRINAVVGHMPRRADITIHGRAKLNEKGQNYD